MLERKEQAAKVVALVAVPKTVLVLVLCAKAPLVVAQNAVQAVVVLFSVLLLKLLEQLKQHLPFQIIRLSMNVEGSAIQALCPPVQPSPDAPSLLKDLCLTLGMPFPCR